VLDVSDSRLKLRRAQAHLDEITAQVRRWNDSDSCRLEFMQHLDLAVDGWVLHVDQPIPDDLAVVVGEFVGALRSALDYLAWQIFLLGGGRENEPAARHIYFPVAGSIEQWRKDLKSKLPTAWPDARDCILRHQPFRSADDSEALLQLVDLSAVDKHRAPYVVASVSWDTGDVPMSVPQDPTVRIGIDMPQVVSLTTVGPQVLVRRSYFRGDPPGTIVPRWNGMEMNRPPEPALSIGVIGARPVALVDLAPMLAKITAIVDDVEHLVIP
jgi:hypothetical protein